MKKLSELILEYVDKDGSLYTEADTTITILNLVRELEREIMFLKRLAKKGLEDETPS